MKRKRIKEGDTVQEHSTGQQLYILAGHWKSDLRFYRDDLRFLHHLIDKYFIWITKKEHLDKVLKLKAELHRLQTKSENLLLQVLEHQGQLGHYVERTNGNDIGINMKNHVHLEEEMATFVKSFRANRKEVMKLSGYIIDSEGLSNILET